MVVHNGVPLASGPFGVPKGELGGPRFDPSSAPQCLITNVVPTNALQEAIFGDIKALLAKLDGAQT